MSTDHDIDSDAALCALAQEGDAAAQERIYRRHAPMVYSVAVRMLGQPAQAEEVLQETFVKVLTRLGTLREGVALGGWIRRVAVNECLQLLRSPWRRRGEALTEAPAASERPDRAIDLDAALRRLPGTTRAVVWLHDVEGYTHREIADMMGQSVSFSKSRLARGHRQLRDELDGHQETSPCMPALNNS